MDVKTQIVTQIVMTCLMAFSMSGIMAAIALGLDKFTVSMWMSQFIIAWPIAFVATSILWPVASRISKLILGQR
ncbi:MULTISPECIES: DUF2798 domain-containing protein [unclassified Aminobacter]|jgi:hypothetical protein|uniref:DUF2798 domain-containing protein n=1 Tax=unclassified Aminobacter TaxID=2644704 RepID=UPI000467AFCB|nr:MULTISPECIES: DUF2798 domain-containing protein [unclassified Aminobacter]TWG61012.1 uncharacterized protein DUF2798 [Aminobacter sp. J44]TWH27205.1 uncharacterized protein DUF2798 [Aminobacter sp. J15]